jgi:glycosyl hydrolase family 123
MKNMLIFMGFLVVLSIITTGCTTLVEWKVNHKVFEKKISNFNDSGSVIKWQTIDNAKVKRVKLNDGEFAAALYLPKYVSGPEQWPMMQLTVKNGLPENWSSYDALQLDCRKQTSLLVSLGIFAGDSVGGKAWIKPALDRESWQTVQLTLENQKVNLKKINRFRIYVTRPGADMVINVKNIRLVSFLPQKLERLAKAYRAFGAAKEAEHIISTFKKLNNREISLEAGNKLASAWERDIRKIQMNCLRREFRQQHSGTNYAVAFADSMTKILPTHGVIPATICENYELSLAKNEYEAFQVVIVPPKERELRNVSITVSSENKQLERSIQVAPVGFVKTKHPTYSVEYIGWYPDPILEFASHVNIKAGDVQPFWIRVYAAKNMEAGTYDCQLKVSAKNEKDIFIPFTIKIFNFSIPQKGHLRTAISLYSSKLLKYGPQMYQAYDYVLGKYRLNPFSIYTDSAYGTPRIHPISEYTKRLELGLNAIPIIYLKLPRQALHSGTKNSKARWKALPADKKLKYPEKEAENVMRTLAKRVPELKRAGLYDMAYCYGMDEATVGEWQACADLCRRIKSKYPDIKIYSTAYDQSYGTKSALGNALDAWIPHDNLYNYTLAEKVRKQGKEVWWYSTRMFIDEKPLWEIRSQMGDQAFKQKVDGFLYWTISRWSGVNDNPITKVPYTNWAAMTYTGHNGGGSFLCMGPDKQLLPTIRLENIRDGLEDYEYLYKLKELVKNTPVDKRGPRYKQAKAILKSKAASGMKAIRIQRERIADIITE